MSRYEETLKMLQTMFPDQILLSVDDLAKLTGLSKKTVYNKVAPAYNGKKFLKPVRHSRLLKFRVHDVAKYIASL
jgi:predicted DNA-binding transcriptional regulator AlpA